MLNQYVAIVLIVTFVLAFGEAKPCNFFIGEDVLNQQQSDYVDLFASRADVEDLKKKVDKYDRLKSNDVLKRDLVVSKYMIFFNPFCPICGVHDEIDRILLYILCLVMICIWF